MAQIVEPSGFTVVVFPLFNQTEVVLADLTSKAAVSLKVTLEEIL